jgi:hypothetical protein
MRLAAEIVLVFSATQWVVCCIGNLMEIEPMKVVSVAITGCLAALIAIALAVLGGR